MVKQDFNKLEQELDHTFKNQSLIKDALTHSSTGNATNYERLEFLGDRVLGLVIAEILFEKFPNEPEGDLAKRLSALAQGSFIAKIAAEIKLGSYVSFSEGERAAGGAENENILADVFESVIGAMYLDAGLEECRRVIEKLWGDHFFNMKEPPLHPKTALQEWAQSQGIALPAYEIIAQSGPDHAPLFDVRLTIEGHDPLVVQGRSRQEAEKHAAMKFLKKIGQIQ